MAEFKSTISSQNFDKALQGGLDYAADKSGIQEALKELSAKGFVYIGPDQPTDGTMYWLDTSVDEPDEPVVPDEPDVPDDPEVTLTSISATYSGGDVAVGTALTALTGIVVTATYSDGSTATVTGYTLSGTIAEGSNTITVTYEGKTATFTVTGVAAEDTSELMCASNIVLANHIISKNTKYDFYQLDALSGANVYEIPVEAGATYELSVYNKYSGIPQWGDARLDTFNDNLSGVIAEKLTNFETIGSRVNGYDFVASTYDTNVVQTPAETGGYKNTITMTPTIDGYFYCDNRNVVKNGYPAMSVKKVVS